MADQFSIETKLKITGVEVKGSLDAGTLKFKVDTSALKKLVSDAANAAKRVKSKFDNIKLNKLKVEVNQNSLRTIESQIRRAVQNAIQKTQLQIQTNVAGGTKADPFKAQRIAAGKSAQSLQTMHQLLKSVNSGLRSLVSTLGRVPAGAGAPAKGNLPFPSTAQVVPVGSLGGGGGGPPRQGGGITPPGDFGRGRDGVQQLARGMRQLSDNTQQAADHMIDLEELTFQVGRKAAAFRGVAIAINTLINATQAAVKFIIEFNDSLLEVNKILQLSNKSLQLLGDDLFSLSAKTGVATDQTIAIAESFARAGLSGRGYGSIVELADRALTGLQGTTLDASQASELFIQIIQQVEGGVRGLNKELITSTKLFDVLGKAEDITASRATDVQQAFKRSAASIFATGASIEEATAIISVLQERTQRGGDVIGTALKTLASRISSSSSDATKALNAIGVETIDAQGNLRNLFDVLEDTSVAFQGLTESERANVAVKVAGIRQVEVLRAALLDFSRTQEVTRQLQEASGDATRKQAVEQRKLANVLARTELALQQIVRNVSEGIIGEAFVLAVESVEKFLTAIANVDRVTGGLLSTFATLVGVVTGLRVLIPMFVGISRAFRFFIGQQKAATAGMGEIRQGGTLVADTIEGKINASMTRTATLITQANAAMAGFAATTAAAAANAQNLAAASAVAGARGPAGRGGLDLAGGAIVAGGAGGRDFRAFQQLGFGRITGVVQKEVGILGKAAAGTSKALQGITKNVGIFSIATALAGTGLRAFGSELRDRGHGTAATALETGGSAISGFGAGAFIGSFLGPIGTAIGGGVGALAGSLPTLVRAFDDAEREIEQLSQRYIELNIIQTENGKITSEVAARLDKALRNLEAFRELETTLFRRGVAGTPEESAERASQVERSRESALKGLLSGFTKSESATEQNTRVLEAVTAVLQERTGQRDIDLTDRQFRTAGSPGLDVITPGTLNEIEAELESLALGLGASVEELRGAFDEEVAKVQGDNIGEALPAILDRALSTLRGAAGARQTERVQESLIRSQQELVEAFDSVRLVEPFDRALTGNVNRIELTLRDFISDFARQLDKLRETQIRATTTEENLAQALADNAAKNLRAAQERLDLDLTDIRKRARQEFQDIPTLNIAEKQFKSLDELRAVLEDGLIPPDAESRIRQAGEDLDRFVQTASSIKIAELFEISESDAQKIQAVASKTTGQAFEAIFDALTAASRRIVDQDIVGPQAQRRVLEEAGLGLGADIRSEEFKQISDIVLDAAKKSLEAQGAFFDASIANNRAQAEALSKTLSKQQEELALNQRRREILSLSARATMEELTSIRRLVAEREIETSLIDDQIGDQQAHLDTINALIQAREEQLNLDKNNISLQNQLNTLRKKQANTELDLQELIEKRQIQLLRNVLQTAGEVVNVTRQVADAERLRIGSLSEIAGLLSVDTNQMSQFNAELESLSAQFRTSQAELAAEAAAVRASPIFDQAEREDRLEKIRRRGAAIAFEQAKAEAQIIQKRREAIKQVVQDLLGNQQEQVDAQRAVLEATRAVGDAFENYLQAVDGAIMATTRYNLGLSLAEVETTRLTGGFSGLREQIGVVQDSFRDAERLARDLGASERTLVEIRRQSISEQLALFNNLLQEQSQLARNFFTSSTQDQADLFLGVREAGSIAESLGGSFSEFKKLGEGAINDLGAQLLALPQETRQRVISSLETLRAVGGEVGGFTADQLLTAIETASLGVSGEGLQVDPLFEIQERIATLQEEQARLATEQLLASQEQVINAKEQLEQAEAARDLAEIQLERIKEEGEKLRTKLGDLQGQLNTTLLQQEQTQRQGFNAVTSAIDRAANAVVSQLPDAFSVRVAEAFREAMSAGGLADPELLAAVSVSRPTPETTGKLMADAQRESGRNRAQTQQMFSQGGPSTLNQVVAASSAPSGGGTGNLNDLNNETVRRLEDILTELRDLNTTSESSLAVTEAIRDSSGNTLGTANAVVGNQGTEITINVEGQTTVTVTGFEAGVARLATTLAETLGGFVSDDEARRIANEVLENIRTELLRRGIITPTTL